MTENAGLEKGHSRERQQGSSKKLPLLAVNAKGNMNNGEKFIKRSADFTCSSEIQAEMTTEEGGGTESRHT